jgi:radical SAM superfamily enzyme YgiQ (UPF0313 family)
MKITLISPFPDIVSLGIRTLSACLKKEGYSVQILFMRREFWKRYEPSELRAMVDLSKDSGLIGICVFSNWYDNAIQITAQLKSAVRVPIVWGGIHPTIRPEECLDHVDIVCVSEAEHSLVELAKRIDAGQDFYDIQNMFFKKDGKIIRNPLRPLLMDLDVLPFPDYDYEDHFILHKGKLERARSELMEKYLGDQYMLMATRGCPYACTYCAHNTLRGIDKDYVRVRRRSPKNLIREMIAAKKKLPFIRGIKIPDDAFFCYPEKELQEFCEGYRAHIELPLCIRGVHPAACDRTKLTMLAAAGLHSLRMGLQSCSKRTLALYDRKVSLEKMLESISMVNEFREQIDDVQYDIILDNPWESEADLIETLMAVVKFKPPYTLALFSLTFFPGTELYQKAKREGLIKDDLKDVYRKYFLAPRKTYINALFQLLDVYAHRRQQLPVWCMTFLTAPWGRRIGIAYLFYLFLRLENTLHSFVLLVSKGLSDIVRGDRTRFARWFANKTAKFSS